ncbi:hypothetical protein FNV58_01105 (plasmid) [Streptomyces sp. RLB1-9]|uniref:DUF6283 family protein n=1 Tax=Streptomyces sp. RLB1-9 TaxID=2594454 RepID=UPI001162DB35|nr:DUF6283 family protein [Streptomyces sp. RLB1-9]QDN94959.1 hypothetical protein FNV58_01105 [Streptomyces sp. RLB1-9]
MTVQPPARRPCASCPYREDVPPGIWAEKEYAKLPTFDEPTWAQPGTLFLCHQHDRDDDRARVCAGWAGCHDMSQSLGLRIAAASGEVTPETAEAIYDYVSPVPLFASGAEAAAHGRSGIDDPDIDAVLAIRKIERRRTDLTEPKGN